VVVPGVDSFGRNITALNSDAARTAAKVVKRAIFDLLSYHERVTFGKVS